MNTARRRIFGLAIGACVAFAAAASADSITLRDGTVLDGVVERTEGGYEVRQSDGKRRFVSVGEVRSIKLDNDGKVSEADARERLASLRRSVEADRDLDRIVGRYEQFVGMNAGTEASTLAQKELDEWRDRRDRRMVKVGPRWLTPADRDAALVAAAREVDAVRALMAAERFDEAAVRVRAAREQDPENVSFLYLNGVLQLRREQWPEAKRSFDAVAAQVADHPPTLVNLAVLASQFKRWAQAIAYLDEAMTLAPGIAEILDDVIELEQVLPEAQRRSPAFERMMKRFVAQEVELERRQAERGLYRWGSQWVDRATLEQAERDREAFEKRKAELEADYAATQEQIRKADENIAYYRGVISRIEADSLVRDANGKVFRRAYPPAYWDAQRDLDRAQRERGLANEHVAGLRKQADVVKQNEPRPPYAGKLTPIGESGVPVVLPAAPTTGPARGPTTEPSTGPSGVPATMPVDEGPATTSPTMVGPVPATRATSDGLFDE